MPVKGHTAFIGYGDVVDDTDERGFSSTVRPKQSEHFPFGHADAYVIKGCMFGKSLDDAFGNNIIGGNGNGAVCDFLDIYCTF